MIRKDSKTYKSGIKTHIRVVEGYRDENGKIKQRTIKSFGFLEDQPDQEAFLNMVKEFDDNYFLSKKDKKDSFKRKFNESTSNKPYNYGYRFLETIYDSLKLDDFFRTKYSKAAYSLSDIFKYLVIQRILNPDSKRATAQAKDMFYRLNTDFKLENIYRSLDKFDEYKIELQKYINDRIKEITGRDTSYAYYDVTNYYCEIDFPPSPEDLRQRGVSKEHRVDPIIQLGLFIDDNSIPISMSLFKGNTSDTKTLQPVMNEIKTEYGLKRLIVVADRGLNSSSNIEYIVNNGDGYVVSQIIRGKKGKRYQERIFDDSLYTYNQQRTFKYQEFIEDYEIINQEGIKETRQRKVLIYWKYEEALKEARKREEKIARALKSLGNNAYAIKHSYEQYIKELHSVKSTGEVAEETTRTIDNTKIDEDAKYDGYFCIITSELDFDYKKILEIYKGLWRIEESFRITKNDLEVRPIYLSTESHINGHFITCFVALVIIRMFQYKLNYTLSVERIVRALNSSKCLVEEDQTIKVLQNETLMSFKGNSLSFDDKDEALTDYLKILETFRSDIPFERYKIINFNSFLNKIKY
ncbi:MAG: IS1634 family transposase [Bacilli bacterium]|jgi:transposase